MKLFEHGVTSSTGPSTDVGKTMSTPSSVCTHQPVEQSSLEKLLEGVLLEWETLYSACRLHYAHPLVRPVVSGEPTPEFIEKFQITENELWIGELTVYLQNPLSTEKRLTLLQSINTITPLLSAAVCKNYWQTGDVDQMSFVFPSENLVQSAILRESQICIRQRQTVSMLLLTCDEFESTSIRYGEFAAHKLLSRFLTTIQNAIRSYDSLLRYSRTEFALILNNTDIKTAELIGQRLATLLAGQDYAVSPSDRINLSGSIGCAEADMQGTVEDMIWCAQECLRVAGEQGGNTVIALPETGLFENQQCSA